MNTRVPKMDGIRLISMAGHFLESFHECLKFGFQNPRTARADMDSVKLAFRNQLPHFACADAEPLRGFRHGQQLGMLFCLGDRLHGCVLICAFCFMVSIIAYWYN